MTSSNVTSLAMKVFALVILAYIGWHLWLSRS